MAITVKDGVLYFDVEDIIVDGENFSPKTETKVDGESIIIQPEESKSCIDK